MLGFSVAARLLVLVLGVCQTGSTRTCKLTACATAVEVCLADRTWGPCACDCGDGDACTVDGWTGSQCSDAPLGTDDGNPCTADSCDAVLGVRHVPVPAGTSCSDGNPCNGSEVCAANATCAAGTPPAVWFGSQQRSVHG